MTIQEQYQAKCKSPQEVVALIESGMYVDCDIALSAPPAILKALEERVQLDPSLHDIKLDTSLELQPMACLSNPEIADRLRPISWFSGGQARKAVHAGLADVMPGNYTDNVVFRRDYCDFDVFTAVVSPMDEHGYFSFGTTASCVVSSLSNARILLLEVNKYMPRAIHGPRVHISQVTALCENHAPLLTVPNAPIDPISETIGHYIADQIDDGATIQLGIGAIPNAVGMFLKEKRHLGIHTEMLTNSLVELIECGAADNSLKPLHTGTTVATFAFGSQRIYDFINNNPSVKMLPANEVNSPNVIAQHPNFASINAALEVDFYGQVCAESIGTYHISGTGGQTDFVRGAVASPGGMSFIAFPSTAQDGKVSRIKPILTPGAIVSTSKNDVDMIVTEYGIAKLRGRTLSQRVKALIAIAHPQFREELTSAAKKQHILI